MLIEPNRVIDSISVKKYLEKISLGIKELWVPQIRKYLVLIFVLLGVYFLYTWGFVRPAIATSFGFYSKEQAVILPMITLSIAYLIRFIPWLKNRISDFSGLTVLGFILAFGFIASAFPIGYWGIIPMFFIAFAGKFASPWIAIIVNKEISSKYRATTLSTISLLSKIPYVAVAILIGQAAERNMLSQFCFGIGSVILTSIFLSAILYFFSKKT